MGSCPVTPPDCCKDDDQLIPQYDGNLTIESDSDIESEINFNNPIPVIVSLNRLPKPSVTPRSTANTQIKESFYCNTTACCCESEPTERVQ
jgi:hypothetical protein